MLFPLQIIRTSTNWSVNFGSGLNCKFSFRCCSLWSEKADSHLWVQFFGGQYIGLGRSLLGHSSASGSGRWRGGRDTRTLIAMSPALVGTKF